MEGAQALDGVGGLAHTFEGEVELVPVGHAEQQEADGGRLVSLEQKIAQGVEVALGLGHLLAFDQQEAHMKPVPRKRLVRGGLGLCDLVLVVREHQVFAARMQIEALAQVLHRHGRALDMPTRAAFTQSGLPTRFACPVRSRLGCLPQREVAGRVLVVLVHIDARAVFDTREVLLGKFAVLRVARDAEVPRAALGLVGDVLRREPLDELDHAVDVLGGACDRFWALHAKRIHVFEERALELRAVVRDGLARFTGSPDDLIVHVGDVHHVLQLQAEEPRGAPEHVNMQEGAEVADVSVVVHGGAATVKTQSVSVGSEHGLQLAAHGVEELKIHA